MHVIWRHVPRSHCYQMMGPENREFVSYDDVVLTNGGDVVHV